MITIRVSKMNVIYFMYITGYNSLYLYMYNDTIAKKNYLIKDLNERGEYIYLKLTKPGNL